MVSVEKITDKFSQLDEFLLILKGMQSTPLEAFLGDKILIGSAKYYLQVSIECCLDIANHIIAAETFRAPRDYADSFKVLEEHAILNADQGIKLRQMAKFRNRLVHLYGEIDDAYLYEFVSKDLQDILDFKKVIAAKFLTPPEASSNESPQRR
ncbi:MAG: hypothetical protein AMK69_13730 [Nitrospira bacterium SG8_3]|nr:MAG: hypothetical protein AMK69_13730 [Nitrospira bacterium SG8_3]